MRRSILLLLVPVLNGGLPAAAQTPPDPVAEPAAALMPETRFAELALDCVHREYPNKISHVMTSDDEVAPPRALTPVFYGCFDWHSSVHGHWLLARLLRLHPDAPFAPAAEAALERSFAAERVAREVAYVTHEERESFERPYGIAWFLQLMAELREWDDPRAARWVDTLEPLESALVANTAEWLTKLAYPIRIGEHAQTAFAFGLMLDWAAAAGQPEFGDLVARKAFEFHFTDTECPLDYEPSGQDFLSPCLAEADLMRRILDPEAYARWLDEFLPEIPDGDRADWLQLAEVTDRSDGKLAHLDGLHLSRAWMLDGILHGLPEDDPRRAPLAIARDLHREAGLASVTGEYYEGGHWLGSFATYLVTRRGLAADAPDVTPERAHTSVAMVDHARRRIRTADPQLHSVIALSPEARDRAAALDAEAEAGQRRGPLHGVPVLIKDNIETGEMPTTAGSLALKDNRTGRDAPLVSNLRDAGLVMLGKANLSEWANFRDEDSSWGWSAMGGQARNPWDTDRSPCGSSSGSAVAVAAGLVPLAVGTETNGSIICPAAVNGIVGIKPTVGLISRSGIVPIAHSQDTAGPMAMNVETAALLLGAMEGHDPSDPATDLALDHLGRDYAAQLRADGLRGMRVGVIRSESFHEGVDRVFEQAVRDLDRTGAELVDGLEFPEWPEGFWEASMDVLLYEFRHDLNTYLAGLPNALNTLTLADLIAFNREHADTEMPWFGQDRFERAEATGDAGGLGAERYREALDRVQGFTRETLNTLMSEHELDVLVMPSNAPASTIDWVIGDRYVGGNTSMAAISGYPHLTVPMGRWKGLPVGLSFVGRAFSEPLLIRAAYAYEQATRHARTPHGYTPWPWPVPLAVPAASSQNTGQQGLPFGRVAGKGLVVPALVGEGARCEVAEGEQGEREACG